MDFNYWIIIIVITLVFQWLRKRMRGQSSQRLRGPVSPPKPGEKKEEKGLPDWLKELGFADLAQEEEEEIESTEIVKEEEIPLSKTLREEIETFDESSYLPEEFEETEPEVKPILEKPPDRLEFKPMGVISETRLKTTLAKRKEHHWTSPDVKVDIRKSRFGERIYNIEGLRDLIVLREILGPPRALQRYRSSLR